MYIVDVIASKISLLQKVLYVYYTINHMNDLSKVKSQLNDELS